MLKFCFPERDPETIDGDGSDDLDSDSKGKKLKGTKKSKETNFYVPIEQKDDVEKMKVKYCSIKCITNSVAPKPKGSSACSQESATGSYPQPTGDTLYCPSQSFLQSVLIAAHSIPYNGCR
jgi:hypothetical protein